MRLLVIRLSAMGDVALTTPVIGAVTAKYPDTRIFMLTRKSFGPFFNGIYNLETFFPDFKVRHKGLKGIFRLCTDIKKKGKIDYVIDLHDVLRTKVLRLLFRLSGVPVAVVDKGRRQKSDIVNGLSKKPLKHTVERYMETFSRAGFGADPLSGRSLNFSDDALAKTDELLGPPTQLKIGVAPYAMHDLKMWPEKNMIELLNMIADVNARFFIFGGPDEKEKISRFSGLVRGAENMAGRLSLEEELALISRLDFMISMDSSNMHMAALTGTKVISIWGGTDPITGFGAWMQPENYSLKISFKELSCRPCTVYGKGKCRRGDRACLEWLTPSKVFGMIKANGLLTSDDSKINREK